MSDGPLTDGLACGLNVIATAREYKKNKQTTFKDLIKTYVNESIEITTS
jgi:hypothetical protein